MEKFQPYGKKKVVNTGFEKIVILLRKTALPDTTDIQLEVRARQLLMLYDRMKWRSPKTA